jgi:hypothetical protein
MVFINEKIEKLSKKKDDKDPKELENNYLENMKKNFYNVSTNKNLTISSKSQTLNIFDNKTHTSNAGEFYFIF